MDFLIQNIGTIIVALVVIAVIVAVVLVMVNDKKKGKSLCGASCKCCPNSELCHKAHKNVKKQ